MKLLILIPILLILAALTNGKSNEEKVQKEALGKVFYENVLKDLGGKKTYWTEITFEQPTETSYQYMITYKESGKNRGRAKNEAEQIVRASLKRLVSEGRRPADEMIFVTVSAFEEAGKGETGVPLVRNLGTARYNINTDKIEFSYPEN